MVTTHNFEDYTQEQAANGDLVLKDSNDNEVMRWSVADEEWVFPAVNTVSAAITKLDLGDRGQETVSAGAIAYNQNFTQLMPESGSSDTLTTINGGDSGNVLFLQGSSGNTITVDSGADNIFLNGGANKDLVGTGDLLVLLKVSSSNYVEPL